MRRGVGRKDAAAGTASQRAQRHNACATSDGERNVRREGDAMRTRWTVLFAVAAGAMWAWMRSSAAAGDPPATWVGDERAIARPMWREGRIIGEWLALRA